MPVVSQEGPVHASALLKRPEGIIDSLISRASNKIHRVTDAAVWTTTPMDVKSKFMDEPADQRFLGELLGPRSGPPLT
eukprot:4437342-Heterocapsa_arctica.AAC.1